MKNYVPYFVLQIKGLVPIAEHLASSSFKHPKCSRVHFTLNCNIKIWAYTDEVLCLSDVNRFCVNSTSNVLRQQGVNFAYSL